MKDILKGMFTLTAGATGARGLTLLSIPILTRLYSPEQFGIFGLLSSVLLLLVPLATLRYITALPLPRTERTAFALLALCVFFLTAFSTFLLIFAIFFGPYVLAAMGLRDIIPYAFLIPIGVFFSSLLETVGMWATRARAYRAIAGSQIWQTVVGEGSKILMGYLGLGPIGLFGGYVLGQIGGSLKLCKRFLRSFRSYCSGLTIKHVRIVAYRYRGFPINRVPAQLLLGLSIQAPILLTAGYFDTATTGQLALANLGFSLPFILVGQATSRVYFGEISRIGSKNVAEILTLMRQMILTLGCMSLPISIVLFFYAEPILKFVLGSEWGQAGRFISFLAIALTPQFISATVVRSLDALEAHGIVLMLHFARLVVVSSALFIPQSKAAAPEIVVLVYACSLALYYVCQTSVIYWVLNHRKRYVS